MHFLAHGAHGRLRSPGVLAPALFALGGPSEAQYLELHLGLRPACASDLDRASRPGTYNRGYHSPVAEPIPGSGPRRVRYRHTLYHGGDSSGGAIIAARHAPKVRAKRARRSGLGNIRVPKNCVVTQGTKSQSFFVHFLTNAVNVGSISV